MPKAKKFIDKKNAVTFHLVHRSQKDPLIADENAPQHVLVEAAEKQPKGDVTKRKEEERKWGVFYDDDYDYLQHLKDAKDVSGHWAPAVDPSLPAPSPKEKPAKPKKSVRINLPSSVFASEMEEDVGMLNKAAPQSGLRLDLDPDVVAAMDDDFNYDDPENELEDNFMELAMQEGGDEDECSGEGDEDSIGSQQGHGSDETYPESVEFSDDEEMDVSKVRGMGARGGRGEDGKSLFSHYSMSSSAVKRNEGLTLLDRRFEKMFVQYNDTEIGALDCEDIDGYLSPTPEVLKDCMAQFENQKKLYKLDEDKEEVKRIARLRGITEEEEENEINEDELFGMPKDTKPKWDCKSIISTYSNIHNHPRIIELPKKEKKIKISAKTGIPQGVIDGSDSGQVTIKSLTRLNLAQAEMEKGEKGTDDNGSVCGSVLSTFSILSTRPKDETPENRKERKRLLKEYRQMRRIEKKANSQAFKEEKTRQDKITRNNKQNIQGVKIV